MPEAALHKSQVAKAIFSAQVVSEMDYYLKPTSARMTCNVHYEHEFHGHNL
jgi:hypothetical protein